MASVSLLSSFSEPLNKSPIFDSRPFILDVLSFIFFGFFSTISIILSWVIVPRFTRDRIGAVRWLLISASLLIGLIVNPVAYFETPVYVVEALGYYFVLALLGLAVILLQLLYSTTSLNLVVTSLFSTHEDPEDRLPASKSVEELSRDLRRRAQSYRNQSKFSIAMILIALLSGAAVFVLADTIAAMNIDQELRSVVSQLRRAQSLQQSITRSVGSLSRYSDLIEVLRTYNKKISADLLTDDELANIKNSYQRIDDVEIPPDSTTLYREVLNDFEKIEHNIRDLIGTAPQDGAQPAIEATLQKIVDNRSDQDDIRALFSTLSTRIGSILLVIFLVKILTAIFRHSARMSVHCESCADILCLENVSKTEAMPILYAYDIGFDKVPKSPASEIKDIVQHAIGAARAKA